MKVGKITVFDRKASFLFGLTIFWEKQNKNVYNCHVHTTLEMFSWSNNSVPFSEERGRNLTYFRNPDRSSKHNLIDKSDRKYLRVWERVFFISIEFPISYSTFESQSHTFWLGLLLTKSCIFLKTIENIWSLPDKVYLKLYIWSSWQRRKLWSINIFQKSI